MSEQEDAMKKKQEKIETGKDCALGVLATAMVGGVAAGIASTSLIVGILTFFAIAGGLATISFIVKFELLIRD